MTVMRVPVPAPLPSHELRPISPSPVANTIIYYNSAILSRLPTKCEASGSDKTLSLLKNILPAAWRHIHLNGHYTFRGDGQAIDLDAIVAGLELG